LLISRNKREGRGGRERSPRTTAQPTARRRSPADATLRERAEETEEKEKWRPPTGTAPNTTQREAEGRKMIQARRRFRCRRNADILLFLLAFTSLLRYMAGEDTADTAEGEDKTYRFDAIVIGAGWAGINAARTLKANGVSSVLVVEANDFVGGRSRSFNEDGSVNQPPTMLSKQNVPYDAGSEWLYTGQALTQFLHQNGHLYHVDLLVRIES